MVTLLLLFACVGGTSDGKDDPPVDDSGDTGRDETGDPGGCPAVQVAPESLDWVDAPLGEGVARTLSVVNDCAGEGDLSVLPAVDNAAFAVDGAALSLAPGEVASLQVVFTAASYESASGTLSLDTNDPDQGVVLVPLTASVLTDADADDHDALDAGGDDCDDTDAGVHPGAPETWYDGVDQDCDGNDDDQDGDGWAVDLDCDDTVTGVNPDAAETWYDGVDQDCDGNDDDQDLDGWSRGADCDDTDPERSPSASERWYDGVDQDCDGASDDDADRDGFDSELQGGDDCDDTNATVYPGAAETWYDGVDQDCDGASDDDADRDGFDAEARGGDDCADTDPARHPGAAEAWYDDVDQDCDGNDDDQDGDTWSRGDDCADTDPARHPGAAEAWYDDVDQDCSGGSDWDQDGDGAEVWPRGTDCVDTDPSSTAPTEEVRNGLDDDCDGAVDEGLVEVGDVLVTEVMANPAAASDTYAEWFEVQNTTEHTIDLSGWVVYADDGGSFTISGSLPVEAGGYAVLAVEDDTTLNGGVIPDYVYARAAFPFADNGDSIYLVAGDVTVSELVWTSSWAESSGNAMGLDDDHLVGAGAASMANWCTTTETFGRGDTGTPGAPNPDCASLDDDGDGASATDCDDDDAGRYPGADEVPNGVDDNCDGRVDELEWDPDVEPTLSGPAPGSYLGTAGVGDFDGDGDVEVAVRATHSNAVYLVPGAVYPDWSGTIPAAAEGSFTLSSSWDDYHDRATGSADVTGDGVHDLLFSATDAGAAFEVFAGPLPVGVSGATPDVAFQPGEPGGYQALDAATDFDGDGVAEVVFGIGYSRYSWGSYAGSAGIFEVGGATGVLDWGDATVRLLGSGDARCGTALEPGDFDGDGNADLFVGCFNGDAYLWLGDGLATPGTPTLSSVASTTVVFGAMYSRFLYAEDLDADGADDLVFTDGSGTGWFFDVAGRGSISSVSPDASAEFALYGGAGAVDSDGDGLGERLWTTWETADSSVFTLAPTAADDGEVSLGEALWGGRARDFPFAVADAADLDGDGDVEVLVSSVARESWSGGLLVVEP